MCHAGRWIFLHRLRLSERKSEFNTNDLTKYRQTAGLRDLASRCGSSHNLVDEHLPNLAHTGTGLLDGGSVGGTAGAFSAPARISRAFVRVRASLSVRSRTRRRVLSSPSLPSLFLAVSTVPESEEGVIKGHNSSTGPISKRTVGGDQGGRQWQHIR